MKTYNIFTHYGVVTISAKNYVIDSAGILKLYTGTETGDEIPVAIFNNWSHILEKREETVCE